MQNEITVNDNFPEVKEEKLKSVARHREEYSLARDLRAKEDNEAIARRFAKDKEKNVAAPVAADSLQKETD